MNSRTSKNPRRLPRGTISIALAALVAMTLPVTASDSFKDVEDAWQNWKPERANHEILRTYPHYDIFLAASLEHGISTELLMAVAKWESNFENAIVKNQSLPPTWDCGVMQINFPATAHDLGFDTRGELLDVTRNIHAGASYLDKQIDYYSGNIFRALAAYNRGRGNVPRIGSIDRIGGRYTAGVADRIEELRTRRYSGSVSGAVSGAGDCFAETRWYATAAGMLRRVREVDSNLPLDILERGRGEEVRYRLFLTAASERESSRYRKRIYRILGYTPSGCK